jgi:ATP diphosphatase
VEGTLLPPLVNRILVVHSMATETERPAPSPDERVLADDRVAALGRLVAIVDRLRAPDGCPWDRKQTLATMAPCLIEEAYETLEAIERGRDAEIAEEAGDVLMVVALIARIAQDEGRFDLASSANAIADKLVRRHPHVFGDVRADSADAALASWESVKREERAGKKEDASALAGIPAALPALQRARRVCEKAVAAGFRWSDASEAVAKIAEEERELREALEGGDPARIEHELGDVLLAGAFAASYLGLDPEKLCRDALRRFESRFREMEGALESPLASHSKETLLAAWAKVKSSGT